MIAQCLYLAKNFVVCYGFANQDDLIINPNDRSAYFNESVYVREGSALLNGETQVIEGLNDVSKYYGEKNIYKVETENFSWIAINPIPMQNNLQITAIQGKKQSITGTDKDHAIVCVDGVVFADGILIPQSNYAQIPNGKTVEVDATNGVFLLIVSP